MLPSGHDEFDQERARCIAQQGADSQERQQAVDFFVDTAKHKYTYNFSWLGRPIIQYPQDIGVMQEIIWETIPDLIIETGIVHGGALIFSASMLALLDMADAIERGASINPEKSRRMVLGIDLIYAPINASP